MIDPGKTYIADDQGMAITPATVEIIVVWSNDTDVYYRLKGDTEINQTTLERFREIVKER